MKAFFLVLLLVSGCSIPTFNDIILRPSPVIEQTPGNMGYTYQEFSIPITADRNVIAWYVPSATSMGLVVVFPGSDANKSRYLASLQVFNPKGYDVLLFDYEGFGSSPGVKSLETALDDVIVVTGYAKNLHTKVFIYAASLGTPLLAYIGATFELSGCLFEGCFIPQQEVELWLRQNGYNLPFLWDAANAYIYPQMPEQYDILKYIQLVDEPKLFMQSTEDTVTPYESGMRVFNAAKEPKEFWEMRGDHGKMVELDFDAYQNKVITWMNQQ